MEVTTKMSAGNYHAQCNKYRGRAVEIRTNDGRTHKGVIQHVSRNKVYLQPLERSRNFGGFSYGGFRGYGGYRGYRGYGYGGWGVALGTIAALALLPLFFF